MAHLPKDDAIQLFNDNRKRDWSGFEQVLQQRKGKAEGISDNLIDLMMPISEQFAQAHRPYPNSADELQKVINEEFAKEHAL